MFADSSGICMFYKRLSQGLFAPIQAI